MKLARGLAALLVTAALASCGQSATETVTTTVTQTTTTAAATTAPAKHRPSKASASGGRRTTGSWTACDANVAARAPHTSCGFAQNAFYEYWVSDYAASLQVYSPALGVSLATRCSMGAIKVLCRTGDGGRVRFARAALDAYSTDQATAYAAAHNTGTDSSSAFAGGPSASAGANDNAAPPDESPDEAAPSGDGSDEADPPVDERIPNFDEGTGSVVQCADGMYSQSGGRPGACSGHGGVG